VLLPPNVVRYAEEGQGPVHGVRVGGRCVRGAPDGGGRRVSSVRERAARLYGREHLTDGNAETCWASEPVRTHACPARPRARVRGRQGGGEGRGASRAGHTRWWWGGTLPCAAWGRCACAFRAALSARRASCGSCPPGPPLPTRPQRCSPPSYTRLTATASRRTCACLRRHRVRVPDLDAPALSFDVPTCAEVGLVAAVRLVLLDSTDTYGRVTMYSLEVLGDPCIIFEAEHTTGGEKGATPVSAHWARVRGRCCRRRPRRGSRA
jgi:hypothetical protein